MFTKRSADLPAAQLTRPILQPPQACRPHLASFSSKSKVADHSTNRFQASGWHAKTPNMQLLLCFTAKTGLNPRKPSKLKGSGRGSKASNLALLQLNLAQLELLLQTSPARPPIQGRLGGPTWQILGLSRAFSRPKDHPTACQA